jgi:predicted 3-demethylubiquinone-9 3-methyltransferase (glyoxalase superfamily)
MPIRQRIAPCLWFDSQAEEAARYYSEIFPNSRILAVSHYGDAGKEIHQKPAGSVLTVDFELDGQRITALNGGPYFQFNEAVSLQIFCETQEEVESYWDRLSAGGDPAAQQCGWLKDRFGLSWPVVPAVLSDLIRDPDRAKSERAMEALLQMKKLDIAALQRAFNG